jgi:hypothetical protein
LPLYRCIPVPRMLWVQRCTIRTASFNRDFLTVSLDIERLARVALMTKTAEVARCCPVSAVSDCHDMIHVRCETNLAGFAIWICGQFYSAREFPDPAVIEGMTWHTVPLLRRIAFSCSPDSPTSTVPGCLGRRLPFPVSTARAGRGRAPGRMAHFRAPSLARLFLYAFVFYRESDIPIVTSRDPILCFQLFAGNLL